MESMFQQRQCFNNDCRYKVRHITKRKAKNLDDSKLHARLSFKGRNVVSIIANISRFQIDQESNDTKSYFVMYEEM